MLQFLAQAQAPFMQNFFFIFLFIIFLYSNIHDLAQYKHLCLPMLQFLAQAQAPFMQNFFAFWYSFNSISNTEFTLVTLFITIGFNGCFISGKSIIFAGCTNFFWTLWCSIFSRPSIVSMSIGNCHNANKNDSSFHDDIIVWFQSCFDVN